MIVTECLECGNTIAVWIDNAHLLQWQKVACERCGVSIYVEHRRWGGKALSEAAFEEMQRTGKRPAAE